MTDTGTTAFERKVIYSFEERWAWHARQGHMDKYQRWLGGRRNVRRACPRDFIVVSVGENRWVA